MRMEKSPWSKGIPASGMATALALMASAGAKAETSVNGFLHAHYVETLALIPCLTLLVLLAVIVRLDPYIRGEHRQTMRAILIAVFSLVAQNYIEYRLAEGEVRWLARTLAAIYGYAVRPVILVLFLRILHPEKRFIWAWALVGSNAAAYLTGLFSHVCFWIDAQNLFHRGPLGFLCWYVSGLLLLCLFAATIRAFQPQKRRETWVPVTVLALILGSLALDYHVGLIAQPVSYLTIAVVISCMAYYVWLHLQFVGEHERDLVAGQKVQMMLSQIKPHFLYNALGVIKALCESDPPAARDATVMFSRYLRGNMDSISQEGLITFERELEHAQLYLDLEKLRFEEALQVRYDIARTDFSLPPLTLEPLVENAVRHGVRGNADGRGTVTVATREYPDHYEISVTDDGPGFDPEAAPPAEGPEGSHVGLQNVRERLARMCGGALKIDSEPGRGTTATILLPRETEGQRC